jgi:hypothetical protein
LVEHPPGEPLGDAREWKDAIHVAQIAPLGHPPTGQARQDVGDDVMAERRVERVVVVGDRVRGVELVAVLAIDEFVGLRLERRHVGAKRTDAAAV